MAANLLVLHPKDPFRIPDDAATLQQALIGIGFIGEPFEFEGQPHYKPGEEFLYLLTFLGCSPVVSLGEPGKTGDEFVHICLDGPYVEPRFLTADNVKVPHCSCGYRIEEWQEIITSWVNDIEQFRWSCPACERSFRPDQLKWKQCAAFGRFFIKVWGVFEGEAIPGEELIRTLENATGLQWQYSYLCYK